MKRKLALLSATILLIASLCPTISADTIMINDAQETVILEPTTEINSIYDFDTMIPRI